MTKEYRTVPEYLINADTMVILPHFDQHGNLYSVVCEVGRRFYVKQKPWEIINNSCLFNGSSFQGRVEGAIHITKYNRMVPIMICNRQGIYFFPTQSSKSETCIWFAHDHIKAIIAIDSESCEVFLSSRMRVPINSTKAVIETKVNRTAQYRHLVNQRESSWQPHRFPLDLSDHQHLTLERSGAYSFNKKDPEFQL
ncbi:competence protein ComK [Alkalihalobacillus sp. AL-G]|uniref:competence protein ComK n=1 Tax=Alkalihalobacillus sp. AL-G TaxID=2926399 RepID=UPI00272973D2|nr:competence protein ComK [Alkalihalobacillus sp. AL-G]WLD94752.1 competence protein ComK [Alkalihalobacillus sp. AL-G]